MTVLECGRRARRSNIRAFGLQGGNQCSFGNRPGKHYRRWANNCNAACKGDGETTCGGYSANDIYLLNGPRSRGGAKPKTTNVQYVGCFNDFDDDRDLTLVFEAGDMTIDKCAARAVQYKFFGVQAGYQCFAGNEVGKKGSWGAVCDSPCVGDESQTCGGPGANSVYAKTNNEGWGDGFWGRAGDGYGQYISNVQPAENKKYLTMRRPNKKTYAFKIEFRFNEKHLVEDGLVLFGMTYSDQNNTRRYKLQRSAGTYEFNERDVRGKQVLYVCRKHVRRDFRTSVCQGWRHYSHVPA